MPGRFSVDPTMNCTLCDVDTFASATGSSSCADCANGDSTREKEGESRCTRDALTCPAQTYLNDPVGDVSCTGCPVAGTLCAENELTVLPGWWFVPRNKELDDLTELFPCLNDVSCGLDTDEPYRDSTFDDPNCLEGFAVPVPNPDGQPPVMQRKVPLRKCLTKRLFDGTTGDTGTYRVKCAPGYHGVLCGACRLKAPGDAEEGYVRSGQGCQQCWARFTNWVVVGGMAFAAAFVLIFTIAFKSFEAKEGDYLPVIFKMLMSYFQMLMVLGIFKARGTKVFNDLMSLPAQVVGGSVTSMLPVKCLFGSDLYATFLLNMASPLIFPAMTYSVILPVWIIKTIQHRFLISAPPPPPPTKLNAYQRKQWLEKKMLQRRPPPPPSQHWQAWSVFILFSIYPTLVKSIASIFRCTSLIDGVRYLEDDLDVVCWEGFHASFFFPVAVVCSFVYLIGIPLAFVAIIGLNRHHLHLRTFRASFSFLYNGYRLDSPLTSSWEAMVMIRKLCITIIAVALDDPYQQVLVALLLLVTWFGLHQHYEPFADPRLNALEELGLFSLILTQVVSILYLYIDTNVRGKGLAAVTVAVGSFSAQVPTKTFELGITILLVSLNAIAVGAIVVVLIHTVYQKLSDAAMKKKEWDEVASQGWGATTVHRNPYPSHAALSWFRLEADAVVFDEPQHKSARTGATIRSGTTVLVSEQVERYIRAPSSVRGCIFGARVLFLRLEDGGGWIMDRTLRTDTKVAIFAGVTVASASGDRVHRSVLRFSVHQSVPIRASSLRWPYVRTTGEELTAGDEVLVDRRIERRSNACGKAVVTHLHLVDERGWVLLNGNIEDGAGDEAPLRFVGTESLERSSTEGLEPATEYELVCDARVVQHAVWPLVETGETLAEGSRVLVVKREVVQPPRKGAHRPPIITFLELAGERGWIVANHVDGSASAMVAKFVAVREDSVDIPRSCSSMRFRYYAVRDVPVLEEPSPLSHQCVKLVLRTEIERLKALAHNVVAMRDELERLRREREELAQQAAREEEMLQNPFGLMQQVTRKVMAASAFNLRRQHEAEEKAASDSALALQKRIARRNAKTVPAANSASTFMPVASLTASAAPSTVPSTVVSTSAKKGGRSQFRGVKWNGTQWEAQLRVSGERRSFGAFDGEIAAAEAYDDAVRAHPTGKTRALNFPRRAAGTPTAAPASATALEHATTSTSSDIASSVATHAAAVKTVTRSKYRGVKWNGAQWEAQIWVSGEKHSFGTFDSEVAAAEVYDDEVRAHPTGRKRALNFPHRAAGTASAAAAAPEPASSAPKMAPLAKKGGRSQFRGVKWNGTQWEAQLRVSGERRSFGAFDSEIVAAEAYDDAVRANPTVRARALNFPGRAAGTPHVAPTTSSAAAPEAAAAPIKRKGRRQSMADSAAFKRDRAAAAAREQAASAGAFTTASTATPAADFSASSEADVPTGRAEPSGGSGATSGVTSGAESEADADQQADESASGSADDDTSPDGEEDISPEEEQHPTMIESVEIVVKSKKNKLGLSLSCDPYDLSIHVSKISKKGAVWKECKGQVEPGDRITHIGDGALPKWHAPADLETLMTLEDVRTTLAQLGCPLESDEEAVVMGGDETISAEAFGERARDHYIDAAKNMIVTAGRPLKIGLSRELLDASDDDEPAEAPKKIVKPIVRMRQEKGARTQLLVSEIVRLDALGAARARVDAQLKKDLADAGLLGDGDDADDADDADDLQLALPVADAPAPKCGKKKASKVTGQKQYMKLCSGSTTHEQRTVHGVKLGAGWAAGEPLELMSISLGEGADAPTFPCRSRRWLYKVTSSSAALCALTEPELPPHGLLAGPKPGKEGRPPALKKGAFVVVARRITKHVHKFATSSGAKSGELEFVQVREVDLLEANVGRLERTELFASAEEALKAMAAGEPTAAEKAAAAKAAAAKAAATERRTDNAPEAAVAIDDGGDDDNPLSKKETASIKSRAADDEGIEMTVNPLGKEGRDSMEAAGEGEASGEDEDNGSSTARLSTGRRRRRSVIETSASSDAPADGGASSATTPVGGTPSQEATGAEEAAASSTSASAPSAIERKSNGRRRRRSVIDSPASSEGAAAKESGGAASAASVNGVDGADGAGAADAADNAAHGTARGSWWYATVDPATGEELLKFALVDDRDADAAWEIAEMDAEARALEEAVALAASALAEEEERERTKVERLALIKAKKEAVRLQAEEEARARALQKKLDDAAALEMSSSKRRRSSAAARELSSLQLEAEEEAAAAATPSAPEIGVGDHVELSSSHKLLDGARGVVVSVMSTKRLRVKLQQAQDGRRVNKLVAVSKNRCTLIVLEDEPQRGHVVEGEV
jgi:hypothetical protein